MHEVERNTLDTLHTLLERLDPLKTGWCLDAGAGFQDFFASYFQDWGWQAVMIDPNPTPEALAQKVPFETVALCSINGDVQLYQGHDNNTYSLDPAWHEVTGHKHPGYAIIVKGMRYMTLLDKYQIGKVACLKMDIEGSELEVVEQLPCAPVLPLIVTVEYGGGFSRSSGMGGWRPERFRKVQQCIKILSELGYTHYAHCEEQVTIHAYEEEPEGVWRDEAGYGNFVTWGEVDDLD